MLRIAITGVPGVGKTELAKELAKKLTLPFVTTPAEIIFSSSDSKEKLFKKQYAALFEQLKAEKAKTASSGEPGHRRALSGGSPDLGVP